MSKSRPKIPVAWHLAEWMDRLGVKQADMMEKAGWNKTAASLLYNERQDLSSKLLEEAAMVLNCATYELLLRFDDAMAMRRLRESALRIAADDRQAFRGFPDNAPADDTRPKDGTHG